MSPRRYDMTRKRASVAATRRRIVEATLKLHGEKGIFGTSWADIAREADVAVGTVYRNFPSLDELVPACGQLLMERIKPPDPSDIHSIIGDATDPTVRLTRVAECIFAFYERGGKHLESDIRERELPAMKEWEDYMRSMVAGFVAEALKDLPLAGEDVQRLSFLLDQPTYAAMRARGLSTGDAVETVVDVFTRALGLELDRAKTEAGPFVPEA